MIESIVVAAGRAGHIAKVCPMGKDGSKHPRSLFIFCEQVNQHVSDANGEGPASAAGAAGTSSTDEPCCFVRRFVVPLHASADFETRHESLVQGRVDVGCRCVTSALFRSQSMRHNTEIRLCFASAASAGARNSASATAHKEQGQDTMVSVAVSGGLVRELAPNEHAVATRLRLALDTQLPSLRTA